MWKLAFQCMIRLIPVFKQTSLKRRIFDSLNSTIGKILKLIVQTLLTYEEAELSFDIALFMFTKCRKFVEQSRPAILS